MQDVSDYKGGPLYARSISKVVTFYFLGMALQIFVNEEEKEKRKVYSQEAKIINILCTCRDRKALLMDFLVIYYNTPQQ